MLGLAIGIFAIISVAFFGLVCSGLYQSAKFLSKTKSSTYNTKYKTIHSVWAWIGFTSAIVIPILSICMALIFRTYYVTTYITVVVYTILLALLFSKSLYIDYNDNPRSFKDAFHNGIIDVASDCWWLFLPGKVLIYVAALVFMIISQMVDLRIIIPNDFWSEFFKLHEYAILIIISVDAIIEHVIPDFKRILVLLRARNKKEKKKNEIQI